MKHTSAIIASALLLGTSQQALAFGMGELSEAASSFSAPKNQNAQSSLVDTLTSQLGVTPTQASGGAAAIFSQASGNMSETDYASLLNAIPEIGNLGGSASSLSSATSMLGGASSLAQQFSGLGMDASMIGKFTPIILEYVKEKGSAELMGLLSSAL